MHPLPLITNKIKDEALQWLCDNAPVGRPVDVDTESIVVTISVDDEAITALTKEFEHLG